jgi:hypothetical protein
MNGRYRLGSWIIENWARMALPFAVLAYFGRITLSNLVFNGIGLLATIIVVYAIRRRGKPEAGSLRGAEASPRPESLPSVGDLI